jgi:hypothetical protein
VEQRGAPMIRRALYAAHDRWSDPETCWHRYHGNMMATLPYVTLERHGAHCAATFFCVAAEVEISGTMCASSLFSSLLRSTIASVLACPRREKMRERHRQRQTREVSAWQHSGVT